MTELQVLSIFERDVHPEDSWRLVAWSMSKGGNEFTIAGITTPGAPTVAFDDFDRVVEPYRRPAALRRRLTAQSGEQFVRATELWELNQATLQALKRALPAGIFTCDMGLDSWFEDLIIYRGGELMLGVVSHEGEGILRLTTSERAELDGLGLTYRLEGVWVGY